MLLFAAIGEQVDPIEHCIALPQWAVYDHPETYHLKETQVSKAVCLRAEFATAHLSDCPAKCLLHDQG